MPGRRRCKYGATRRKRPTRAHARAWLAKSRTPCSNAQFFKRTSATLRERRLAPLDADARLRTRRRVVAGLASFLVIASSGAQQPPGSSTTLTLIVPTAPGVAGDQLARIVVEALSRIFESPM